MGSSVLERRPRLCRLQARAPPPTNHLNASSSSPSPSLPPPPLPPSAVTHFNQRLFSGVSSNLFSELPQRATRDDQPFTALCSLPSCCCLPSSLPLAASGKRQRSPSCPGPCFRTMEAGVGGLEGTWGAASRCLPARSGSSRCAIRSVCCRERVPHQAGVTSRDLPFHVQGAVVSLGGSRILQLFRSTIGFIYRCVFLPNSTLPFSRTADMPRLSIRPCLFIRPLSVCLSLSIYLSISLSLTLSLPSPKSLSLHLSYCPLLPA